MSSGTEDDLFEVHICSRIGDDVQTHFTAVCKNGGTVELSGEDIREMDYAQNALARKEVFVTDGNCFMWALYRLYEDSSSSYAAAYGAQYAVIVSRPPDRFPKGLSFEQMMREAGLSKA